MLYSEIHKKVFRNIGIEPETQGSTTSEKPLPTEQFVARVRLIKPKSARFHSEIHNNVLRTINTEAKTEKGYYISEIITYRADKWLDFNSFKTKSVRLLLRNPKRIQRNRD